MKACQVHLLGVTPVSHLVGLAVLFHLPVSWRATLATRVVLAVVGAEYRVGAFWASSRTRHQLSCRRPQRGGRHHGVSAGAGAGQHDWGAAQLSIALQGAGPATCCHGRCDCHEDHQGQDEDSGNGAAHGGGLKASAWRVGVLGVSLH